MIKKNKQYIGIFTMITLLSLIILVLIITNKKQNVLTVSNSEKIYACSLKNGIYTIDADTFSIINQTKIDDIFDIDITEDGVIYGIQDKISPTYKEVFVYKDGEIKDSIPLTYDILDIIKYNKYDKNMYISQTSKITKSGENCITVIDTKNNKELKNIMYEDYIIDFTFDENGNIIVISNNNNGEEFKIDIISKNEDKIIKTIELDSKYNNILYKDKKIYLTKNTDKVKIYNLNNDVFNEILLAENNASDMINEGNNLYVLHSNEDNSLGKHLSTINLENNSIETKILSDDNHYNHNSIYISGEKIITSNYKDEYIYNHNLKKKLNIQGVIKILYQ